MNNRKDWAQRQARNEASRARAEQYRQPWGQEELEWLASWDGTEVYLAELAELLGRTIEACRQKFYTSKQGTVTVTETETHTKTKTTIYRGWTEDMGDGWD